MRPIVMNPRRSRVSIPAVGVLLEIRVQEGEKAPIGAVLAVLGEEGESAAPAPARVTAGGPGSSYSTVSCGSRVRATYRRIR